MMAMRHCGRAPQNVAVVAGAFFCVADYRVGFGYAHESPRGVRIRGVVVWVVGFGEGVEGALDLRGRGFRVDI